MFYDDLEEYCWFELGASRETAEQIAKEAYQKNLELVEEYEQECELRKLFDKYGLDCWDTEIDF